MKRGALVNLLIGISIALLPLYIRICSVDFQRTSKDNLLVVLFSLFTALLPSANRKASAYSMFLLFASLFFLVMNQWNVLSINVLFHCFYMVSGITFLYAFYEKHDQESLDYILNGMIMGCLIQCSLAIPGYFGIDPYRELVIRMVGGVPTLLANVGSGTTFGSLGNINLTSSYLGLTSLAILRLKKHRWTFIFPAISMILNGSIMGIAALVAGLFYYLNLNLNIIKKWQIYLASMLGMIIYPFSGIGYDSGRIEIWSNILKLVNLRHFLIGMGPGWFIDQRLNQVAGVILAQEHNEYLAFFNIFGLLGIILVIPLVYKFIMKKDENKLFSTVVFAAFVNSYGHFALHQSTVTIIILVAMAISMAEGNKA